MDELIEAFKKNPIAWTIFTCYFIGWISPMLINIFFASQTANSDQKNSHHSTYMGFLILPIFYLLIVLILGFIFKKNNIYLKLSGYIGISLVIFAAI